MRPAGVRVRDLRDMGNCPIDKNIKVISVFLPMNPTHCLTQERSAATFNGWVMLPVLILALVGALLWSVTNLAAIVLIVVILYLFRGFFTLQPNEARVLILFGAYRGSARAPGFHWTNPLCTISRVSLRARNLNTEHLKVSTWRTLRLT